MKKIIFGTDWWTDCDDLAAMRILLRAHKNKEIELLGVGINACMEYSAASVDGFLCKEGVRDVPLAIDLKGTDFNGTHLKYQKYLSTFSENIKKNDDVIDAVKLYRHILANSKEKVEIIEVGFLQVLADVLLSSADEESPLSGLELVKEKVEKVWIMAGDWSKDGGLEHNFNNNPRSIKGAKTVCGICPVPIVFLGFELGIKVMCGDTLSRDDFMYEAFLLHGSENGRFSWDPLTVLLAIDEKRDDDFEFIYGTANVDENTGANHFCENLSGIHSYVKFKKDSKYYADKLNLLIN